MEEEPVLKKFSRQVAAILKPVATCMIIVVASIRLLFLEDEESSSSSGGLRTSSSSGKSTEEEIGDGLIQALIFVGAIVGATLVMVLLYKFGCVKIIKLWLLTTTSILLGLMGFAYIVYVEKEARVVDKFQIQTDYLSLIYFLYNFAVVGMVSIFWEGPLIVQQGYLVCVSVLLGTFLANMPEWTTWALVTFMALYDLCAVLTPCGPLQMLIKSAEESNTPIPALLYSADRDTQIRLRHDQGPQDEELSTVVAIGQELPNHIASTPPQPDQPTVPVLAPGSANKSPSPDEPVTESLEEAREPSEDDGNELEVEHDFERGLKLGLGDFVFYSVLVARAAFFDMTTTITSFIGIITGLCMTLACLFIFKRALPALPISVAFGMIFYFLTRFAILDLVHASAMEMVVF